MYAYVKFLEGPNAGKKYRVPVSKINSNFKSATFDSGRKYLTEANDGKQYKSQIIFMSETEDELKICIESSRPKIKPLSQLFTASETEDNEPQTKKPKMTLAEIDTKKSNYDKHLAIKIEKLEAKNANATLKCSSSKEINNSNKIDPVLPESKTSKNLISFSKIMNMESESLRSLINNGCDVKDPSSNIDINRDISRKNQITTKGDKKNKDRNHSHKDFFKNMRDSKKPKIVTNEVVHSATECNNKFNELKNKYEDSKKVNKKLKTENESLTMKVNQLEAKLEKAMGNYNEYAELNIKLQKLLIERVEETAILEKQVTNISNEIDMNHRENFLPVGRERNGKVHIGRDIWIDRNAYNHIMSKSKSPSNCVSQITVAIFDEKTILKSTVTGRASNKSLKNKKILGIKEEMLTLDPVRLSAGKDLYNHWLKNEYEIVMKGDPSYSYAMEYANYNEYVSKKISYEKRQIKKADKEQSSSCSNAYIKKKKGLINKNENEVAELNTTKTIANEDGTQNAAQDESDTSTLVIETEDSGALDNMNSEKNVTEKLSDDEDNENSNSFDSFSSIDASELI